MDCKHTYHIVDRTCTKCGKHIYEDLKTKKTMERTSQELREFKDGDRVWTYGFGYEEHEGTIHKNVEHPEVSEWYIAYDDGEECAVIDINGVYKIDR